MSQKKIPRKRLCPVCNLPLEADEEYIFSQYGENAKVPLKDYPWSCSECEKVWFWDDQLGKWES